MENNPKVLITTEKVGERNMWHSQSLVKPDANQEDFDIALGNTKFKGHLYDCAPADLPVTTIMDGKVVKSSGLSRHMMVAGTLLNNAKGDAFLIKKAREVDGKWAINIEPYVGQDIFKDGDLVELLKEIDKDNEKSKQPKRYKKR